MGCIFKYRLRLGNNYLSGTIPTSFGKLSNLTYLEPENNMLTGQIPPELGLCHSLALLNFGYNNLSGTLQEQLGKLMNLQANCANILWCFLGKELDVFSHIFSYVYLLGL